MNRNRTTSLVAINISGHAGAIQGVTRAEWRDNRSFDFRGVEAWDKSILLLADRHSEITFVCRPVGLAIGNTRLLGETAP